ncbi:hypothetical protein ACEPAH_3996 [Sanghuangporus vaninii]
MLDSTSKETKPAVSDSEHAPLPEIDTEDERRVVRKLDICLIPLMAMFYLLSFLDRGNIGNARVAGLQKDLGISEKQYQICLTITYIPYIFAELPANLLLRKVGPNILMPTVLTVWGLVCICQGFTKSFAGLAAARAFLGLAEGPMFPGIVLYLSGFYTRRELSLRIALFFSAASLSGAFSGLLASAIVNMDGLGGKPGWSWIFILEGLFTVLVGIVSFFLVPSSPKTIQYLTPSEKILVCRRILLDRATADIDDRFSIREIIASLCSPHVLLNLVSFFMAGNILYGLAIFLPSIVSRLGFSPTHTQLLSVGPFAVGFVFALGTAYVSDRFKKRALCAAFAAGVAGVGFIVFFCSQSRSIAYGSLFLSVSGTYAFAPPFAAWLSNNSEPHYRRASIIALGFIATNCGGILSTWSFPDSDGPRFRRATVTNIVFAILIIIITLVNVFYLKWADREKEHHRAEILAPYCSSEASPTDGGKEAWLELGDRHPDFKYSL